jgi:hypothetical protein
MKQREAAICSLLTHAIDQLQQIKHDAESTRQEILSEMRELGITKCRFRKRRSPKIAG